MSRRQKRSLHCNEKIQPVVFEEEEEASRERMGQFLETGRGKK
jgi:hypothetical protein